MRRALTALVILMIVVPLTSRPSLAASNAVTSTGTPDCPHSTGSTGSGNYGSSACLLTVTAFLLESNFTNGHMYVAPALVAEGDHVLHALWAYSGIPCTSFIEQTYVYGYNYHNFYENVIVRVDAHYYSGGASRYQAFPDGAAGEGQATKWQTKYIGNSLWQAWRNDSLRYQTPDMGTMGQGACIGQAGLEVSKRPGSTGIEPSYVSYTHEQYLYWYDTNMAYKGGWGHFWNWIDYPCNQGQTPPYCLNGTFYTDYWWSDNKP